MLNNQLWWVLIICALGTFAMRALPLLWMRRHLDNKGQGSELPLWLRVLGPAMIAAMMGVSLVPGEINIATVCASIMGVAVTLMTWWRVRSLGLPVLLGVLAYGVVFALLS